jgi:hypothetical protein
MNMILMVAAVAALAMPAVKEQARAPQECRVCQASQSETKHNLTIIYKRTKDADAN